MSAFFISGYAELSAERSAANLAALNELDLRRAELTQLAYMELARFEFAVMDIADKKPTLATQTLFAAQQRSGRLSHGRAKQRTLSYNPVHGSEHCPHCWVFEGVKHAIRFTPDEHYETAVCGRCSHQFQLATDPA